MIFPDKKILSYQVFEKTLNSFKTQSKTKNQNPKIQTRKIKTQKGGKLVLPKL